MFTGIIYNTARLDKITQKAGATSFFFTVVPEALEGIVLGASVAINGVCLTVVSLGLGEFVCDAIPETLKKTNLSNLTIGDEVHFERSARMTDEVGGHRLSGHVYGKAKCISVVDGDKEGKVVRFSVPFEWMKYILHKGFIAIDGCSLTVVDPDTKKGEFSVCFIPHTLKSTLFEGIVVSDLVNIEIDSHTQAIVDTVERVLLEKNK